MGRGAGRQQTESIAVCTALYGSLSFGFLSLPFPPPPLYFISEVLTRLSYSETDFQHVQDPELPHKDTHSYTVVKGTGHRVKWGHSPAAVPLEPDAFPDRHLFLFTKVPSVCQIGAAGPQASKEDSDSPIVTMYAGHN